MRISFTFFWITESNYFILITIIQSFLNRHSHKFNRLFCNFLLDLKSFKHMKLNFWPQWTYSKIKLNKFT